MNLDTEKIIDQVEEDVARGINLSPRFESAKEAIAWLNMQTK